MRRRTSRGSCYYRKPSLEPLEGRYLLSAYVSEKLTGDDTSPGDYFGGSTDIDGDTVVVGASGDDDDGSNSGSAYVFRRSGATWIQQAKLTSNDASWGDNFGNSVSIDGDTVVVGAKYVDLHFLKNGLFVATWSLV